MTAPAHSLYPWRAPRLTTLFKLSTLGAICALGAALGGCATYHAAPLPGAPSFPATVPHAALDGIEGALPALAPRAFDASDGLDFDEVATLAVVNNPELRIARSAAGVSAAQAFAARLLPDPQVSLTRDLPDVTGAGITSAFVAGASYAINALITHAATVDAADADVRQARGNLLWQEWQVIAQARLLYVRLDAAQRRRDLLERTRTLMAERYRRTGEALAAGLLTADAVAPHLAALQDVERQLHDLERQTNQADSDLHALLGLSPDTALRLQGGPALPPFDTEAVRAGANGRLAARPDIAALREGYAAQDARLRVALLGQFPALTLGVQRSRDTSNSYTRGFGITLGLPVFNGNRGEIAVQNATRDKLRAEYQQRLNVGVSDIARVTAEQAISLRQLAGIDAAIVQLEASAQRVHAAWQAGNADALALASAQAALLAKQGERIDAMQALQEQRVGLLTLTGGYDAALKEHA
ncbi:MULTISPECIES: TolC family protein [unclassified Variovorax]|uniref:TolC family protein n=1 Tax=unclassified Variovorax TaxID=663243 RepID=UPI0008CAD32E|nr:MULTISPECIES: TolC family protein [unclassified Variovorax]SEK15901.1 Outer membrane protein TolC [Variovorax sp. OK202]SFE23307.1 Outer membrane protein TolC [Variovorax sp. OK212]